METTARTTSATTAPTTTTSFDLNVNTIIRKKKVFPKRTNHRHHLNQQDWQRHRHRHQYHQRHFDGHYAYSTYLILKCITILMIPWMTAEVVAAPPHVAAAGGGGVGVVGGNNKLNRAAWPPMKHHDIWNDDKQEFKASEKHEGADDYEIYDDGDTRHSNYMDAANDDSIQTLRDIDWNLYSFKNSTTTANANFKRQNRVIHLFPVPVDGECLSNDGRRTGTCFNAYECRNKGGQAKGECAHGFGVCCIYIANCNETITNNITYLVSPSFPSFMPNNVTNCNLKIKLMNDDISQLRFDFYHFILGQPNRRTGACDGDVFNISGGPGGPLSLCGQNSGQHVYYDVGGRMLPRQTLYGALRPLRYEDLYPGRNATGDTSMEIDINLHFAPRFLPTRLWEIRIAQIPFSQRAPAGCLQYFTGAEGVFQTFNFADNGRHLANQNYRICMRQEVEMCSIVYQPCDDQSFRIGPSLGTRLTSPQNGVGVSPGVGQTSTVVMNMPPMDNVQLMNQLQMQMLSDDVAEAAIQMDMSTNGIITTSTVSTVSSSQMTTTTPATVSASTASSASTTLETTTSTAAPPAADDPEESSESAISSTTPMPTVVSSASPPAETTTSTAAPPAADDPEESSESPVSSTNPATNNSPSTSNAPSTTTTTSQQNDDVEGSGGEEDGDTRFRPTPSNVSKRPRPTRGGFDLLGFLRTAFEMRFRNARQGKHLTDRQRRQFYSNCRDRITMPCIVEDFIGTGLGPLPGCEPVHCGMQFCSNGIWPCRIESTVTPFYVGIHFGDGAGKGSPEDNIGACLRYQQVQCM